MEEAVIRRILRALNIRYVKLEAPSKGYRNSCYPALLPGGERLNVILYKREAGIAGRIRRGDALSTFLAAAGLPARVAHSDIIVLSAKTNGNTDANTPAKAAAAGERYARIYNYLPGQTISWESYTMKHIKALGSGLSRLHATAQGYDSRELRQADIIRDSRQLLTRMEAYFAGPAVRQAQADKLGLRFAPDAFAGSRQLLDGDKLTTLPRQALHMDFVRGNILFQDSTISGIIDFEKAAWGPVVFDIARTLAFLLVDCKHKPAGKVYKYFLQSGYLKHGSRRTGVAELQPLARLTLFFLLHDYYKFLRHNPYESLSGNQHFLRTRDILLKNGMMNYIEPEPYKDL